MINAQRGKKICHCQSNSDFNNILYRLYKREKKEHRKSFKDIAFPSVAVIYTRTIKFKWSTYTYRRNNEEQRAGIFIKVTVHADNVNTQSYIWSAVIVHVNT